MNKKIMLCLTVIIAVLGIFIYLNKRNLQTTGSEDNEQIILFYGNGCPHCEKVDKFLDENKVEQKIPFEKKEVFQNQKNAEQLAEKAKKCGLLTEQIGVPFLWNGVDARCFIGDEDIIDFFKDKVDIR